MTFRLLCLHAYPIYEQLLLEEALLRGDTGNWCLINRGSPPAIVMGISGKREELIDSERMRAAELPLIRRFSGGGTVLVDEDTLFVTFICEKALHDFPAYPEPIMRWTETLYKEMFPHPTFALKENDFVLGAKKCGGNAQYIKKHKWLHHTSFLWNYDDAKMECLLHPKKTPTYRDGRSHSEFLCRLHHHFDTQGQVTARLIAALRARYAVEEVSLEEAVALVPSAGRLATVLLY